MQLTSEARYVYRIFLKTKVVLRFFIFIEGRCETRWLVWSEEPSLTFNPDARVIKVFKECGGQDSNFYGVGKSTDHILFGSEVICLIACQSIYSQYFRTFIAIILPCTTVHGGRDLEPKGGPCGFSPFPLPVGHRVLFPHSLFLASGRIDLAPYSN